MSEMEAVYKSSDVKILAWDERHYPAPLPELDRRIKTVAVLVEGANGDYTAYVGHGRPDWVALHGMKIPFEEAHAVFAPAGFILEREKYRV